MAQPLIMTYYDVVAAATDYCGNTDTASQRDIRRAIAAAYREVGEEFTWSFLFKQGRVHVKAPYETGTITYDHTGGTYERELTLADGTWPAWADDAVVRIDDIVHHVATRESDTVLTLDVNLNPGADIAAGTSYSLYKPYYHLPHDFESMVAPSSEDEWVFGREVSYDDIMTIERNVDDTGGLRYFCVRGVDDLIGSLGVYLYPPTDANETVDFMYKRRSRQLRHTGWDANDIAGTIEVTADSATVTGTGTAFNSSMVGSILRIGDATNVPSGLDGVYPFAEERSIISVASTTSLTLDAGVASSASGVKYCITDPVDIGYPLFNAFLRCVEKHLALQRNMKHKQEAMYAYEDALRKARRGDHRVTQRRVVGQTTWFGYRPSDTTLGDDVE